MDTQLKQAAFATFNAAEALEVIKADILNEIRQGNRGCSAEDLIFYIDVNFHQYFTHGAILIAECLADSSSANNYYKKKKGYGKNHAFTGCQPHKFPWQYDEATSLGLGRTPTSEWGYPKGYPHSLLAHVIISAESDAITFSRMVDVLLPGEGVTECFTHQAGQQSAAPLFL